MKHAAQEHVMLHYNVIKNLNAGALLWSLSKTKRVLESTTVAHGLAMIYSVQDIVKRQS